MEQLLVHLIDDAKRWADKGRDYLPTLGCSSCGKGCMPLCGLGINRKVSPMENKDIVLQTRKTMLEIGKNSQSVTLQVKHISMFLFVVKREIKVARNFQV
jgi:hypothetical protein